ncbi:MAG: hypothetical protein EOP83_05060 [Verrucomicrobiaceae bacterium]|nr:MAG: hypothetical protein EOP83_05060 [Verrucomicrobiaceae bacterium]
MSPRNPTREVDQHTFLHNPFCAHWACVHADEYKLDRDLLMPSPDDYNPVYAAYHATIRKWIAENGQGDFYLHGWLESRTSENRGVPLKFMVWFEDHATAMHFKLRWS